MKIDYSRKTNFQGGFRLINLSPEVKEQVPSIIKKHRQVFDNFEKQGDVFLVVKDVANTKVAKFIKDNKINFEFYPTINTKSGLDTERPCDLTNLIANIKDTPITNFSQFRKNVVMQKREKYITNNSPEYIDKILKTLCIDNKHQINNIKGVMVITDKEYNRKILISPPSKLKIHYVKVESEILDNPIERYAIDSNGNILATYQTPNGIMTFNKRFNDLLLK